MTKRKTKAPANVPALKLPAKEPVAPTPDQETPTPDPAVKPELASTNLVEPLGQNAFQLILQIIDNADFKGREASQVLAVKMELIRVAGLKVQAPGDGQ